MITGQSVAWVVVPLKLIKFIYSSTRHLHTYFSVHFSYIPGYVLHCIFHFVVEKVNYMRKEAKNCFDFDQHYLHVTINELLLCWITVRGRIFEKISIPTFAMLLRNGWEWEWEQDFRSYGQYRWDCTSHHHIKVTSKMSHYYTGSFVCVVSV